MEALATKENSREKFDGDQIDRGQPLSAKHKSVIIIGAGIAGLAAARKLSDSNLQLDLTILEASDKIGGRISTRRDLGFCFEEGANWIHGDIGNPIEDLAQKAKIDTLIMDIQSSKLYDVGGVERGLEVFNQYLMDYRELYVSMAQSGSNDESFASVFSRLYPERAKDRVWKYFLSVWLTFSQGDLNKLSSVNYNQEESYDGDNKFVCNGYDRVLEILADGIKIDLHQIVESIDYSGEKVKVTHNGTVTEADAVLVTVPLGVLQFGSIQFAPALPEYKQKAISSVGMNCVNKFVLVWEKAFWDDVIYIFYTPEYADKFNMFVNLKKTDPNLNGLVTFAFADVARSTEQMEDSDIIKEIMTHLRDMYGDQIPEPVKFSRTKWHSNPFSRGSYSYPKVGTEMEYFNQMADDIDKKVFFAGEHTSREFFGNTHGALQTGEREAEKILNHFALQD